MSSELIDRARRLAGEGRARDGRDLLSTAGDDAAALMELAVWHLTGTAIARDVAAARRLIRRAVEIGHVDGALMEVALTANGTGGRPDWADARALLAAAAADDPVAAAQLRLVEAMSLDPAGAPTVLPAAEQLSAAPLVVRFPQLLTPDECAHLAGVAGDLLEPATVLDPATGRRIAHPIRTSDTMVIGPTREDLVVRAINLRIAAISRTPVDQGEPLAVMRYRPSAQYRAHLDTIAGATNQRVMTVLVYLNGGFGGGETVFPELSLSITPRGGDAIMFAGTRTDGSPDTRSRHAGLPVTYGAKWLATRWIRQSPIDPWTIGEPV